MAKHEKFPSSLLNINQISAWQVESGVTPDIRAALPALQRGFVWKPKQTEDLWDSITRGFPIGSFLLSQFDEHKGYQSFKLQNSVEKSNQPTHHLLDGQQRATAIALGFYNPWRNKISDAKAILWVDLLPPPEADERVFVFRVVTFSHPWGYRYDYPEQRLEYRDMRRALKAYKEGTPNYQDLTPSKFPLTHVWPWDAHLPVPVPLLIDSMQAGDNISSKLLAMFECLPFWGSESLTTKVGEWKNRIIEDLKDPNSLAKCRLEQLVSKLNLLFKKDTSYYIPALIMPSSKDEEIQDEVPASEKRQDPMETLFIRINAAGTRLEGEELIYSILKSIWPQAPDFIDNELQNRLVPPSRLVVLVARLVLSETESGMQRAPGTPDVGRFRRLMQGKDSECPDFGSRLQNYIKTTAPRVFNCAHALLCKNSFALPPFLASDLGRQQTLDIFFLFLRWIDRMIRSDLNPEQIGDDRQKRMLGMISSLAWFSPNPKSCLATLWKPLQEQKMKGLENFFCRSHFKLVLSLLKDGRFAMIPLPPPSCLKKVFENRITSARADYGGFNKEEHKFWKNWNWYEWLNEGLNNLNDLYGGKIHKLWKQPAGDEEKHPKSKAELDTKLLEAWNAFLDNLWKERRLVLFAQREWLIKWFPDYDLTLPDQIEDMNRPWDFDHIHPSKYILKKHNIPTIIREWHFTIGNLRAWPLEANRSDGELPPREKLSKPNDLEKRYHISTTGELRNASFVSKTDWRYWKESTPPDEDFDNNYLAISKYGGYHEARKKLIHAITTRLCNLYKHWYYTLKINELMP